MVPATPELHGCRVGAAGAPEARPEPARPSTPRRPGSLVVAGACSWGRVRDQADSGAAMELLELHLLGRLVHRARPPPRLPVDDVGRRDAEGRSKPRRGSDRCAGLMGVDDVSGVIVE